MDGRWFRREETTLSGMPENEEITKEIERRKKHMPDINLHQFKENIRTITGTIYTIGECVDHKEITITCSLTFHKQIIEEWRLLIPEWTLNLKDWDRTVNSSKDLPSKVQPTTPWPRPDAVNHPIHYGGEDNPFEAIKVIEAWGLGFCLGNTVKYISRAGKKVMETTGALEDLKKARWYLDRQITTLEKYIEGSK